VLTIVLIVLDQLTTVPLVNPQELTNLIVLVHQDNTKELTKIVTNVTLFVLPVMKDQETVLPVKETEPQPHLVLAQPVSMKPMLTIVPLVISNVPLVNPPPTSVLLVLVTEPTNQPVTVQATLMKFPDKLIVQFVDLNV